MRHGKMPRILQQNHWPVNKFLWPKFLTLPGKSRLDLMNEYSFSIMSFLVFIVFISC